MSGSSSSVSIFPSGPLAADRLAAIAAAEVHEQHWLALVLATRLVRGPFPTAHAIELDVNQFAAGEGSLNLVRGYDQGGRTLWDLLWLDDDVAWTTTEGRDWSEVLGHPACSAKAITGTSPAHDTRSSSSNSAAACGQA